MYKLEKTFTSETRSGLKVKFSSENIGIKIKGTENESSVLNLELEYKSKSDNEYEVSDFLKLDYNNELNEMKLEFTEPESMRIMRAKLVLEVPRKSEIHSKTENGPVALASLEGNQVIETENGPVALVGITGKVDLTGENGPVSASEIEGDITIKIENSPVKLREISGRCNINGENGIIKIKDGAGDLKIENENGQIRIMKASYETSEINNCNGGIYYEFLPLEQGNFKFNNENGKISLIVPEEIQCDLTAGNELGKINIGIEGNYERQKDKGRTSIHLLKGSGRVKITASNNNGSINVSKEGLKKSSSFNFSGFGDMFDEIISNIPDKEKAKVKIELEKAQEKLDNIDFNKIEAKVNSAVKKIEKVVEREFDSEKNKEILNKVKVNLSKAMENFDIGNRQPHSESKPDRTNEESRIMILKMLQDGKITSEEAEKLLKAIGD